MIPTLNPNLDEQGVKEAIDAYYFSELEKINEIACREGCGWEDHLSLLGSRMPLQDLREEKPFLYGFVELKGLVENKICLYGGVSEKKMIGISNMRNMSEGLESYISFKALQEGFFSLLAIYTKELGGYSTSNGKHSKYSTFKKEAAALLSQRANVHVKSVIASPFLFFRSIPEVVEYVSTPFHEFMENGSSSYVAPESISAEMEDIARFNVDMLRLINFYSDNEVLALKILK
jgi:hypothetical protein